MNLNFKNKANLALIAVILLFIPSVIIKLIYRDSFLANMVSFILEASLVGSIADWFAVTALFRRPLGFSWHTAIIPKNREKLVNSMSSMVQDELLGSGELLKKLDSLEIMPLVGSIIDYLCRDGRLSSAAEALLNDRLAQLDTEAVPEYLEGFIKENLRKINLSESAIPWLENNFNEGNHKDWLSALFERLAAYVESDGAGRRIYKLLKSSYSAGKSGGMVKRSFLSFIGKGERINLFSISDMLQKELASMLREMKDISNPLSIEIAKRLEEGLKGKNAYEAAELLNVWKDGVLESLELKSELKALVASVINSRSLRGRLSKWLSAELESYLMKVKRGKVDAALLEDTLKKALSSFIISRHHLIGSTVGDTLSALSDDRLVSFFEEKVGDDLQWIRINGTIVGGAVGALLFLFVNLFYDPVVVPVIRRLAGL